MKVRSNDQIVKTDNKDYRSTNKNYLWDKNEN